MGRRDNYEHQHIAALIKPGRKPRRSAQKFRRREPQNQADHDCRNDHHDLAGRINHIGKQRAKHDRQ